MQMKRKLKNIRNIHVKYLIETESEDENDLK